MTFLAYGAACYLLGLRAVATALAPVARSIPFGDFYLHAPARLHYGVLLAVPVLAGLGADAWRDRRSPRHRVLMILPSVVVFAALPTLLGYRWGGQWIPLSGMLVGGSVLALSAKRPRFLPLVPLALSMELVAGGLAGQTGAVHLTPSTARFTLKELQPLTRPGIDVGAYLRPDRFANLIRAGEPGRYVPLLQHPWGSAGTRSIAATSRSRPRGTGPCSRTNAPCCSGSRTPGPRTTPSS